MKKEHLVIAAFDFDGTLSYQDTLISFFQFMFGKRKTYLILLSLFPRLIGFPFGLMSRTHAKELILSAFLKGKNMAAIEEYGRKFAAGPLMKKIRLNGLERLKWHQEQGHTTILISANFSFFMYPWADLMGFTYHRASLAGIDAKGDLTGKLDGSNCWGEEKVNRLKALFGPKSNYTLYAYGDSQGDAALLAYADYPYFRPFRKKPIV